MEATVIISPSGLPSECYRDTELRMCSAVVAECLTVAFTVCSFPVAAVTNYHKRGTLKEQKSGLFEVHHQFPGPHSLQPISCLLQLLVAANIPLLAATSLQSLLLSS